MTSALRSADDDRLFRRIGRRLLPLLMLSYMLAYMDRVNIAFAKLQMQDALGIDEAAYGLAAGIFFIGYALFEVPSNLLLARVGARKTLSRIMLLWGATSMAMMVVKDVRGLYFLRFLLGVFEAGFGPGMIYYLTLWYGKERRARVLSYVLLAAPVGAIVGGPLSGAIMTAFDGIWALRGWQWLFILEGLPCVLLSGVLFLVLDDGPGQARWLSPAERGRVEHVLDRSDPAGHPSFGAALKDPNTYTLALSAFGSTAGLYTVSFWMPTLLSSAGFGKVAIGFFYALPYVCAIGVMVAYARLSDRAGERRWHSLLATVVGAVAVAVAALTLDHFALSFTALTVALCAIYSGFTVFWAIPSDYFRGEAAAGSVAFINSVGLFGGFVSPSIIGILKQATGTLETGLLAMAVLLLLGAGMLFLNRPNAPER